MIWWGALAHCADKTHDRRGGDFFAHREVVAKNSNLLKYYRLLACLPAKGPAQIRAAWRDEEVFCEGEARKSSLSYDFLAEHHNKSCENAAENRARYRSGIDLIDIFRDARKRSAFLVELFKFRLREKI